MPVRAVAAFESELQKVDLTKKLVNVTRTIADLRKRVPVQTSMCDWLGALLVTATFGLGVAATGGIVATAYAVKFGYFAKCCFCLSRGIGTVTLVVGAVMWTLS